MIAFLFFLLLFFALHLLPFFPEYRNRVIKRIGSEEMYKVAFAVVALLLLILMGLSKASTPYIELWFTPNILRYLVILLVFPAFVLIVGAYLPSNIKRYVPHPMLTGIIIWGTAHIIANGDVVSLILFGSFIAYSGAAMYLSNKRGLEKHTEVYPHQKDLIVVGIAAVTFILIYMLHGPLFGRTVLLPTP